MGSFAPGSCSSELQPSIRKRFFFFFFSLVFKETDKQDTASSDKNISLDVTDFKR